MMDRDKFDLTTRKAVHLISHRPFVAADGTEIEAVDYNGFKIKEIGGGQALFLLLSPQDADMFAIDVTDDDRVGRFRIFEL